MTLRELWFYIVDTPIDLDGLNRELNSSFNSAIILLIALAFVIGAFIGWRNYGK